MKTESVAINCLEKTKTADPLIHFPLRASSHSVNATVNFAFWGLLLQLFDAPKCDPGQVQHDFAGRLDTLMLCSPHASYGLGIPSESTIKPLQILINNRRPWFSEMTVVPQESSPNRCVQQFVTCNKA